MSDLTALFETQFILKAGFLVVSIVIAVLQFGESNSRAKGVGRVLVILTIAGLGLTFLDQVFETQQEVESTRKTLDEIKRTIERIERVRAYVEVVVGSDHRGLSPYRDRLADQKSRCLRQLASQHEMSDPLGSGWPIPRDYQVEEECLPDPEREQFASRALGFLVLELRFFRRGRQVGQFTDEELAKAEPDLSIPLRASIADKTLQLSYDQEQQAFRLTSWSLEGDSQILDGNGLLAAIGDLAGSRMVVDLQAASGDSELSKSIRLGRIRLRFAGARSLTIDSSREHFERVDRGPFVRYLYRFPDDLTSDLTL